MLTLVRRSLDRAAWPCVAIGVLLTVFQLGLVAAATSLAEQRSFERLAQSVPGFVRNFLGGSLASFEGMVTIGYFEPVPVLMVVLFAVYLASEPAGEIESGLVDLVLARPVSRHVLVTRTILVMVLLPAAIVAAMTGALIAGLLWIAPQGTTWPDAGTVGLSIVYLLAVTWCFGAMALAVAATVRRRAAVILPVAVAAVALYLLESLGEAWGPAAALAPLSPFDYFPGAALLDRHVDVTMHLSVLGTVTAVAIAVAYWQFVRRDV